MYILLFVFLAIIGHALFWYIKKSKQERKLRLEIKKDEKELDRKVKEGAMREHINHIDKGEKYRKNCGVCEGYW